MDISNFKRNAEKIHSDLETLSDGRIITKSGCKIYIPLKYQDHKLAKVETEIFILAIFAIVLEDGTYGVSNAPAMVKIEPSNILTVKINDEQYYEFTFNKGDTVIANKDVIQNDSLLYEIYNEFISKGSIPWYVTYEDLGKVFALSKHFTGHKLGANKAVMELIVSTIARDPSNLNTYYRQVVETQNDVKKIRPVIVKLNSVTYGATNTMARLIGSNWDEGLNSALINKTEKVEPIEAILRK